eukprot:513511_1
MALQETKESEGKQIRNLTTNDMVNGKWLYMNNNRLLGEIQFLKNGQVGIYNHDNERSWQLRVLAYGYTILEFYGKDKKKKGLFVISSLDGNGMWRLTAPNWTTYLIQVE